MMIQVSYRKPTIKYINYHRVSFLGATNSAVKYLVEFKESQSHPTETTACHH